MQQYSNTFANSLGRPVTSDDGAQIAVYTYPGNVLAVLYSDNGVTPKSNPVTTDENGLFEFYAADGRYTLVLTSDTTEDVTLTDAVLLEDPADNTSAQISFTAAGTGAVTRTAQDKMREVVSVKDFGAVGDGTTDDTAAIQAAINYAQSLTDGACVFIPKGRYKITSSLTIANTKRIEICGDGASSVLLPSGLAGAPVIDINGAVATNLSVLEGFCIAAPLSGTAMGIDANAVTAWKIRNIEFNGLTLPLKVTDSYSLSVEGCYFGNCSDSAIRYFGFAHNGLVRSCAAYNCGVTDSVPVIDFDGAGTSNFTVDDCDFEVIYEAFGLNANTGFMVSNTYIEQVSNKPFNMGATISYGVSILNSFMGVVTNGYVIEYVTGCTISGTQFYNCAVSFGASTSQVRYESNNYKNGTGNELVNSVVIEDAADTGHPTIKTKGFGTNIRLNYNAKGSSSAHYFQIDGVTHASIEYTASVANRAAIYGGAEGGFIAFRPLGGTNCSTRISSRGNGEVGIYTNSISNLAMVFAHVASADNWIQVNPGASGSSVMLSARGNTDTNVNFVIRGKGTTGQAQLQGGSGNAKMAANDTGIGFYGATPAAKPTITGSRGGNAALASLLTDLATLGLITDSTTA